MWSQTIHSKNDTGLRNEFPKCYPFVKWAGGKGQLLSKLDSYFPSKITRYFEPFVGGEAVFFLYYLSKRYQIWIISFWYKWRIDYCI